MMTWTTFTTWMCAIYIPYYALLIFIDRLQYGGLEMAEHAPELTFTQDISPVQASYSPSPALAPAAEILSGGVSFDQLWALARQESIIFSKAISF